MLATRMRMLLLTASAMLCMLKISSCPCAKTAAHGAHTLTWTTECGRFIPLAIMRRHVSQACFPASFMRPR